MAKNVGSEADWINTVLKKGTIADRLAAHTLLIHESKKWSSLDLLIDMVDSKKCRRQCVMVMTTLKELFLDSLNVGKKGSKIETDDDRKQIRFYYTKFVDKLSIIASDSMDDTRKRAIWVLSELLAKHSENKEYILEKLVDKMGDKVPKIASTSGHLIEKAINSDRQELRAKAIKCIQRFLRRPNQSVQARFYAISLLTRIKLIKGLHDMANDLIQIYLELYMTLTKEKKIETKLMSTILVGIHRAYPYAKLGNDVFEQHLQTLYTLVHQVNFRMSVVAMVLIKNIVAKRAQILKCPIEDRFYNLIFGQLLRPELHNCSRQEAFINLLLTTINEDTILERKEAFVKRMLQVAINSKPELAQLFLSTITKINGFNANLNVANTIEENNDVHMKESSDEEEDNEEGENDESQVTSSWVHKPKKMASKHDLLARNPRAAKPDQLNELYLLRQYCNPQVANLAKMITGEHRLVGSAEA